MPSSQCTASTGEALGHPRRWRHKRRCEVELLKGRIVSNELKTKRRAREDTGDENGRREGEGDLHQSTKHWPGERDDPVGAENVDMRAPREREWVRGQRPNACVAGPGARERHRGEHSSRRNGENQKVQRARGPAASETRFAQAKWAK